QGISRAVWTLLTTGEKSVGGSTITQQLARNVFLTLEKTYTRKIKEILLAIKIERELDKNEILELYLNKIFLGYRAYGVGAAADVYYGKNLDQLTLAQTAMMAALPKAPSRINPISNPVRAVERRNYVLGRMLELDYITRGEYQAAIAEPDMAFYHGATAEVSAPYVAEMVRARTLDLLGPEAYTGGFEVRTTIDSRLQLAAQEAVETGLLEYDQRHGYRGAEAQVDLDPQSGPAHWDEVLKPFTPIAGLTPGLVIEADEEIALIYLKQRQTIALTMESMSWAAPFISRDRIGYPPKTVTDVVNVGDIIRARFDNEGRWQLTQLPEAEAALVSLDPRTGDIKALVGGYDFSRSKYNRVIQSRRQPGSSFKPFIYSASLERGFTTASLVNDAPIVFQDSELERTWKPQNFSEKFYGPTRLREAMVNSRNLVSIRLLREIGIDYAREHISRFGFEMEELPNNLSMALGSASLKPLSMARGYAVFANGGYLIEPEFIREIRDAEGRSIYRTEPLILCDDCEDEGEALLTAAPQQEERTAPELRPLEVNFGEEQQSGSGESLAARIARKTEREGGSPYAPRAVSEQNAYLVRSMMMDVIRRGTGKRAMELGRSDLAGKTGTTNEQRDAWFSGYNDALVTTVWVGFDNHAELGRNDVGGRAALPIWIEYMAFALDGVEDRPPEMPDGLAQARIDPETGLLATLDNDDAILEVFESGRLPPTQPQAQGGLKDVATEENPYEIN
ncbi:MAG TPA: PBP1A family penicillin-binding protein, partial [Gammaproteobacteria bacterium]|nr:PBP1A family penicillin-binding protein [Gammaproteobacteria bacterium]